MFAEKRKHNSWTAAGNFAKSHDTNYSDSGR